MKCPLCGSTAQIKLVKEFDWEVNKVKGITRIYECGCGARTQEIYKLAEKKVLDK